MTLPRHNQKGFVSLVGAGPGDCGLLTLKGLQRLQSADLVLYDYLANPQLLKHCRSKTKLVFVGKRRSKKSMSQSAIHALMIREASKGQHVVRLKGGDPFVFGRGGEEALALSDAQIPYEVIPGVSSGVAAPAYAGIPLTHRDYSSEVVFVTGESGQQLSKGDKLDYWKRISKAQTIVIFMGSANLEENSRFLIKSGKKGETPAACIQWGTFPYQKTVKGTLSNLALKAKEANMAAPCLVVIGEVVSLSHQLNWFESRPLSGKKILLTVSEDSDLGANLELLGANICEMPLSHIVPANKKILIKELRKLNKYDWLVMTSQNAIFNLIENIDDLRRLSAVKIAVIGESSAECLKNYGLIADFVAHESHSEGFLKLFSKKVKGKKNILYLRGDLTRGLLSASLIQKGHLLKELVVYKNKAIQYTEDECTKVMDFNADAVVVTSSSAASRFASLWDKNDLEIWKQKRIYTLGPITQASLIKEGFKDVIISKKAAIQSLIETLRQDNLP
ncbi:MAG: hypothetical protein ACD_73C00812G0004 [uncultured bacterium]|nr:MAG: hypothetical protein ACD_73C00812G0004 [uncultured bacterium]